MSDNDHYHYTSDIHDGAEKHHRHYALERADETVQQNIRQFGEGLRELRAELTSALERIRQLEGSTPEARQAEHEADLAKADLAASGYTKEY